MAFAVPSSIFAGVVGFCFVSCLLLSPVASARELSLVVSHSTTLQLSPSVIVEKSPGSKPGAKVICERVRIHGLSRLKHLNKFASSVKVKVSYVNPSGRPPNAEICFHRNVSLGVGMCPQGQWERITKGLWVKSMSPFDHKLLDIRMAGAAETLEVSLSEDFFLYRIIFLVLGVTMLTFASAFSHSLTFYYSSAMAMGILLVILMVLFQGMKLLPTGRKSSLAIFSYSCLVGMGSFLLGYVPRFLRSVLVELGIGEDLYNPLAIFLLIFLVIAGAWLGFWVVRKLVLTEDGSIDVGVSHFVAWSIRIIASVMILQSSVDPLLAMEALISGILFSSVLRRIAHPKAIRRIFRKLYRTVKINQGKSPDPYASPTKETPVYRPFTRIPQTPFYGSTSRSPSHLSESKTFYSTFHNTPERRKFSKDEWEEFTNESTQKALEELVSSPDFSKWAVAHADRITLAPKKETRDQRRKWFLWF